ncbi:MAG: PAS domain S-box protein, partial [Actinomycetota bacterium]
DCVITADHSGRILDFNPAAEKTFGYRREEVVGRTLAETIVPPHLRRAHSAGFRRYLEVGDAKVLERRLEMTGMRADGSEFPVELAITAIENGGRPLFAAYLRDITARRQRDEEMRTSVSLLNATLESTADGILVVNREGTIVNFNHKFVDMWRIPHEIIAARDDERALNCILDQLKDPEAFLARVRELYDSDTEGYDVVEFKDGRVFERYSQPQRVGDKSVGRVWSFRDMTDKRRLESDLLQAQKMEAVGQLAGGIAHDFNNLLAVIANYATFLEEDIDAADPRHSDVVGIRSAAERGAKLVRQLLVFSRKEIVEPQVLDLSEVVLDLEKLLARTIGENIRLSLKQPTSVWPVKVDPGQVEQVLMNLVVNARDAMPTGGELEIETSNAEVGPDPVRHRLSLNPGRYVRVCVRDSGNGMTEEVKARVFEPFFTTKGRGEGTGLGLASVYGIVERAGGHVYVESFPGQGSVFDMYLPVTKERKQAVTSDVPESPGLASGETILVVEDEEGVREIVSRILRRHDYEVRTASSGSEAIELAEIIEGRFDLLLTDVIMPGMSGRALVEELQAVGHDFKILYMSGYAEDIVAREGLLAEGEELIQKPFSADELLVKIRNVLHSVQVAR